MVDQAPASPCVGICRLEGRLCVGCGRDIDEIMGWPAASAASKQTIVEEAAKRLAIIAASSNPKAGSP